MNITHATSEEVKGDKLEAIFNRQKELMAKYHHIEKRSGLLQTEDCPVNLDDKRGQARIKDFSWRVVEEVGEALDARENPMHFCEELIDGLHFLTELTILTGMEPKDLHSIWVKEGWAKEDDSDIMDGVFNRMKEFYIKEELPLPVRVTSLIENLGMACNCLKNKPWKQSNMVTDKQAFRERIAKVWISYFSLLSVCLTVDEVVDIYLKKSQVNQFRQRSNY